MSVDLNFKKAFKEDFQLTMVKAVRSMFDKYYTEAYTGYQVHIIDDMILNSTCGRSINDNERDLRKKCLDKSSWMWKMKDVMLEVKNKVRTRKCNDCCKAYVDCRNTCYKAKPNPTPIELPQDVFNVVKDYMGVYDIPQPVTELMDMLKLKNITDRRKCKLEKSGEIVIIKNMVQWHAEKRVRLFNEHVIRTTKAHLLSKTSMSNRNNSALLDIANRYPQLRFGMELTDNNKIFLLRLLFNNNYYGVNDQGEDGYTTCLFDFMRGDTGISKCRRKTKKIKPYVMYLDDETWSFGKCQVLKHSCDLYFDYECGENRCGVCERCALRSYVRW